MRRFLACLTVAGALVAGAAVTAPTASALTASAQTAATRTAPAQTATAGTQADDEYPRHYIFAGHFPTEEACVAKADEYITTQPWNYYDYICSSSTDRWGEYWTLHLAFYA